MITPEKAKVLLNYINSLGQEAEIVLAPGCKPISSNCVGITEDELRKLDIQESHLDDHKWYDGKTLHWSQGGDVAEPVHEFDKDALVRYAGMVNGRAR